MECTDNKEDNKQPARKNIHQLTARNRSTGFFALIRQGNRLIRGRALFLVMMGLGIFFLTQNVSISMAQSPITGHNESTSSSECLECHSSGVQGGGGISSLAAAVPLADKHTNKDFAGRTQEVFEIGCTTCHDFVHGGGPNIKLIGIYLEVSPTIFVGPVTFTAYSGENSFDDGSSPVSSRICVTCHVSPDRPGAGTALSHSGGAGHLSADYTGQNCTICHAHEPDDNGNVGNGFVALYGGCTGCHAQVQDKADVGPVGGRRAVVLEFGQLTTTTTSIVSHHVISSSGPITANVVTDNDCVVCHSPELTGTSHANGYVQLVDEDSDAIYSEITPGGFRPNNLVVTDNNTLGTFCQSCHDGDGATRLGASALTPFSDGQSPPAVSLHSNTDFGSAAEANFQARCAQCHESHGSDNLANIKSVVMVNPTSTITSGLVVFTSKTGSDSFDEGSGDIDDTDDICTTCHSNPNNPGNPMTGHIGGDHTSTGGGDERDNDCTMCHSHDADSDPATDDGFMPAGGCTTCHVSVQDKGGVGPAGGRRPVVGEFISTTHHVSGTLQDADCKVCHDAETGSAHSNGYVQLTAPDTGTTYTETTAGAFRPENLTNADITVLTTFCQACHDGDGATRLGASATDPFGDGQSPPLVGRHSNNDFGDAAEAGFQVGCVQCHEAHGSDNIAIVKATVLVTEGTTTGPVVFTSKTGVDSFDESDAGDVDDICATCHTNASNPGNPMSSHVGGDHSPAGGSDERGNDCSLCHTHDLDDDPATLDGFMPAGGCTTCHAEVQDLGGVGPAGGRRAVVTEFGGVTATVASHHVISSSGPITANVVTDDDCKLCHDETTGHANGYVTLKNVDTAATYTETTPGDFRPANISAADSQSLAPFCLACHDSDGAGGDTTPFSDAEPVPVVSSTTWYNSAHSTGETTNSGYGCLGDGSGSGCHATGHGSELTTLLAPATGTTAGVGNYNVEEGFCFTCHDGSVAPVDIQAEFARSPLTSSHDISDTVQASRWGGSGPSAVECNNCHNPHLSKASDPLIDPDNPDQLWLECNGDRDFCIACHGNDAPPTGVTFPSTSPGSGWNKSRYIGEAHDNNLSGKECQACHERHGSAADVSLLTDRYQFVEDPGKNNTDWAAAAALCFKCHSVDEIYVNDAGTAKHDSHEDDGGCAHCHNSHAPMEPGEPGLIDWITAAKYEPGINLNGYTTITVFLPGECYVSCHGNGHNRSYVTNTRDSSDCGVCHNAAVGSRRQILDDNVPPDGTGTGGEFISNTHHISPVDYATDYALGQDCRVCHEFSSHQGGTVVLKNPDCNGSIECNESGTLSNKATSLDIFCQNCHDEDGATRLGAGAMTPFSDGNSPVTASIHSNIDGSGVEAAFQASCYQCHNSHGADNLALVKNNPIVAGNVTAGPVVFTSKTGADSFDEDSGDADDIDDICTTCHVNASNPGNPMSSHIGGLHGTDEQRNNDCTICHPHNPDGNASSRDGFMPGGAGGSCTGCHASSQDKAGVGPAGGRRAVVGEFSYTTHHITGTLEAADCEVCHSEPGGHPADGSIGLIDPDSGAVYTESSPGAFRQANMTAADLANLNAFCGNCHDGDGATRLGGSAMDPFGDGQSPLTVSLHSNASYTDAVEGNFQTGCIQCHGSHGSNNRAIINTSLLVTTTGSITTGPVVFTAITGTDSYDEDSGDPSDVDDICAACHINAGNPGNPMVDHAGGDHSTSTLGSDERNNDCTTCHPHDPDTNQATPDGFMPSGIGCTNCHSSVRDKSGVGPAGGRPAVVDEFGYTSHHVTGTLTDGDCETCHAAETSGSNHSDGFVHLTDPDNGATTYVEATEGGYRPENRSAADNTELTTFCQNCHDGDGATRLGGSALSPFSGGQAPLTMTLHGNAAYTNAVEANFQVGCAQCHRAHGSSNLSLVNGTILVNTTGNVTSGLVVFTSKTGTDSFDEDSGDGDDTDDICTVCHTNASNPGNPTVNHVGGLHSGVVGEQRNNDCSSCHLHERDNDPATIDGFMPGDMTCLTCHNISQDKAGVGPTGGRRAVVGEFSDTSHHVIAGMLTAADCEVCHSVEVSGTNHANGYVQLTDPDNTSITYTETSTAAFRVANRTAADEAMLNTFCQNCHDSDGATRLGTPLNPFNDGGSIVAVNMHANTDVTAAIESNFQVGCTRCHGTHGSSNRMIIEATVLVTTTSSITTGPVVFTATTGVDSFDEDSGDGSDVDDICATCHINGSNPGQPMENHSGGDHTSVGGNDERNNDCITCHAHNPDSNPVTQDGFMVSSSNCTGCHAGVMDKTGVGPGGGRNAVVDEFGYTTHHVTGTLVDGDCQVCHLAETSGTNHSDGFVHLTDPDNAGTTYVENSAGGYRPANRNVADNSELTTFCGNCHDGDGATRLGGSALSPFSGGQAPPAVALHGNIAFTDAVEGAFQVGCAQCHTSHGSNNRAIVNATVLYTVGTTVGPVVFTQTTGVDSFDEIDSPENNANNADDLCVTCHIQDTMSNHSGGDHSAAGGSDERGNNCTQCHGHDMDSDPGTIDGFMPLSCLDCHSSVADDTGVGPSGGRRPVVGEFISNTHHVTGTLQASDCQVCHAAESGSNHANGLVQLTDPDTGATYVESGSGNFRPANLPWSDSQTLATFCQNCHDGDGATRLGGSAMDPFGDGQSPVKVSRHSNVNAGSPAEASFQAGCVQCHEAHGSDNLAIIKSSVMVNPTSTTTSGPVVFTSLTGADSFDEVDSPENNANNADDICVTCHINAANPGNPMANHSGGDNHSGGSDQRATNCTLCHPHEPDDDSTTLDGFMPSGGGCTSCHGQPPDGTSSPNRVGSHASHFTAAYGPQFTAGVCTNCHPLDASHPNGQLTFSDGNTLAITNVCDTCHSPNGYYNGVDSTGGSIGAKDNWYTGVYTTLGGVTQTIHTGKDKWCVGCHDDVPSTINSVSAPNVAGDAAQTTYGYYVNGHLSVVCTQCHEPSVSHTDGVVRTYADPGTADSSVYQAGYRLRTVNGGFPLRIPDRTGSDPHALCLACHDGTALLVGTTGTNFYEGTQNLHDKHALQVAKWDSDWSGGANNTKNDDMSCPACHNVHGSQPPAIAMIRTGELIGQTGLNIRWLTSASDPGNDVWVFTSNRASSASGVLQNECDLENDPTCSATLAPMCGGDCHGKFGNGWIYDRSPNTIAAYPTSYEADFDAHDPLTGLVMKSSNSQEMAVWRLNGDPTQVIIGTVNNPAETLPGDGFFHGDGIDNYIDFYSRDTVLQHSTSMQIEMRIKPRGLEGSANLNQTIFDRGAESYWISIWRDNSWPLYNAPAGTASIAFWVKPANASGRAAQKVLLTDYDACPIVSDHWYQIKIEWNSNRAAMPGLIYVDDQGTGGDDAGENWPGYRVCTTDFDQSMVPAEYKLYPGDQINTSPSNFTIGATTDYSNPFNGLLDWLHLDYGLSATGGGPATPIYLPLILKDAGPETQK